MKLLVAAIACMPVLAHAAFGFKLDGTLDRTAISRAYLEGDFHRILPPLETTLSGEGKPVNAWATV